MGLPDNLPQKANIQGFWKLDEESGIRADNSGNDNTLQDNNTVLYGTGEIGNAADFEKDIPEWLSITDALQTGLDITGDITILCWINPETIGGAGVYHHICAKWTTTGGNEGYSFAIDPDAHIRLTTNNGVANRGLSSTGTVSTGSLQHVGVTLDVSETLMTMYIAGSESGTDASAHAAIQDNTSWFGIGGYGDAQLYFDGLIDELIIWNTCLTAEEVLQVKNITAYRYDQTVTGIFVPVGAILKQTNKNVSGIFAPTGTILKNITKNISGVFVATGTVIKLTTKNAFTGVFTATGSLVKSTLKNTSGIITFTGNLSRNIYKIVTGIFAPTGSLLKNTFKILTGIFAPTGAVYKLMSVAIYGIITFRGNVIKTTYKNLTGVLRFRGILRILGWSHILDITTSWTKRIKSALSWSSLSDTTTSWTEIDKQDTDWESGD